jgi:hypothetical protein
MPRGEIDEISGRFGVRVWEQFEGRRLSFVGASTDPPSTAGLAQVGQWVQEVSRLDS